MTEETAPSLGTSARNVQRVALLQPRTGRSASTAARLLLPAEGGGCSQGRASQLGGLQFPRPRTSRGGGGGGRGAGTLHRPPAAPHRTGTSCLGDGGPEATPLPGRLGWGLCPGRDAGGARVLGRVQT